MAKLIEAINAFRPRIDLGPLLTSAELVEYISGRTGLNRGEIRNVLSEFNEAIIYHCRRGIPVRLEGLGIFNPGMDVSGNKKINLRRDVSFRRALNIPGAFTGRIINSANIGMTSTDARAMWDALYPDDLVEG